MPLDWTTGFVSYSLPMTNIKLVFTVYHNLTLITEVMFLSFFIQLKSCVFIFHLSTPLTLAWMSR